jgi:hypothetical protein
MSKKNKLPVIQNNDTETKTVQGAEKAKVVESLDKMTQTKLAIADLRVRYQLSEAQLFQDLGKAEQAVKNSINDAAIAVGINPNRDEGWQYDDSLHAFVRPAKKE